MESGNLMNIRKLGFNIVTKIKKSPIDFFINEFYLSNTDKKKIVSERLVNILSIAKNNTQFYSNYNDFKEFPIITKTTLREEYERFLSNKLNKKKAIITNTSGSTGQPMTFYLSRRKKYRQNAEVIFYNNWANIDIGDPHAYIKVTDIKSKFKLFVQNEILMNPKKLTTDWIDEQVNILSKKNLTGIIGVPSAISAIAHRAKEKNLSKENFQLKGIVSSGETLKKRDKKIMESVFGVEPISRYSTEEFGVLATSCPTCGKFHVNDTGYVIEILSLNSNEHVAVGEHGRVVVTDLFSENMPLIRFDTGDIAIYGGDSNCSFYSSGILLEEVLGRHVETIYDVNGQPLSAFNINGATRDLQTLKQFQFIQNDLTNNYLYIVVTKNFSDIDKNIIKNRFTKILGVTPKIIIVDEIKASKSGKRPYVISNYKKGSSL